MRPEVWIVGALPRTPGLPAALEAADARVTRVPAESLGALAQSAYGGRGLLLVDASEPAGRDALHHPAAGLVRTLAVAAVDEPLPPGVLRLPPSGAAGLLARHVEEVLRQPRNLRRHPRVPARLPVMLDGVPAVSRDLSPYGLCLEPGPQRAAGERVSLEVLVSDAARVRLDGEVVALRPEGLAVRCRPEQDLDLVLWIHRILEGLAESPLHADADPFGSLFEPE